MSSVGACTQRLRNPRCRQWPLRMVGAWSRRGVRPGPARRYRERVAEEADRALDELRAAVRHAQGLLDDVLARADVVLAARAEGQGYSDIVRTSQGPLLVEVLTDVLDELAAAGARFRRAEARVLHEDGLSQEAIGALFGVSRQRVSVLLQDRAAGDGAAAGRRR